MNTSQNPDAYKKELERRSMDSIRVFNPTDTDYYVEWDGYKHRVPGKNKDEGIGKGMRVLPRYIAEKYVREMKNLLINQMNDKRLADIKEKLQKAGTADIVWNANTELERQHDVRTDNPELVKKYYEICWLGVEQEYGMDEVTAPQALPRESYTHSEEDMLKELQNRRYVPSGTNGGQNTAAQSVVEAVKQAQITKNEAVREVSA